MDACKYQTTQLRQLTHQISELEAVGTLRKCMSIMFDNCRSANTVRLTLILLYGFSALVSAQGHMQTLQKVEEEVSKVRTKNVQTQLGSCGSDM